MKFHLGTKSQGWPELWQGLFQKVRYIGCLNSDADGGCVGCSIEKSEYYQDLGSLVTGGYSTIDAFGNAWSVDLDGNASLIFPSFNFEYNFSGSFNRASSGGGSIWEKAKNLVGEDYWNSDMVPVAFSYAWNVGVNPGPGGNISPVGYLYMLKGADAFCGTKIVDFGLGPGWDVSTTLVFTEYKYTGDVSNLRLADFIGDKFSLNLSYSHYGFEGGLGFTVSPVKGGGYIIGYSRQIGAGVPGPGGGINWGKTEFYNK